MILRVTRAPVATLGGTAVTARNERAELLAARVCHIVNTFHKTRLREIGDFAVNGREPGYSPGSVSLYRSGRYGVSADGTSEMARAASSARCRRRTV